MTSYIAINSIVHKETVFAWVMWFCTASYYCYQFMLRVSPGIMSHELMSTFSIQACSLGILSSFYYSAYAAMQIPLGMLMDYFGPRRIIASSCMLAATGTLVFSLAENLHIAAFGRLLVGAGAASGFIGTLKIATLWFPLHRVSHMIGLTMLLGTLGATFGGAPLGFMIDQLGWRYTLIATSIIGFSLALTIYLIVRDHPQEDHTSQVISPLKNFLDGFYLVITTKQIWLLAFYGFLMYVPLATVADLWGTHFISMNYQIDHKLAASVVSFIYMGVVVGSPLMVFFSNIVQKRRVPMFIAALNSLVIYSSIFYLNQVSLELMCVLMFLGGVTFGGQLLIFASAVEIMPPYVTGVVLGFLNMIVMLSGIIFEPLVGWLLDKNWDGQILDKAPIFTPENFKFAFFPIPISLIIALIIIKFIKETYPTVSMKTSQPKAYS